MSSEARIQPGPLIVIHIPKTAGTSLRVMLEQRLAPAERLWIYGTKETLSLDQAGALPAETIRSTRVCMGHFPYGVHERLGVAPRYATVLRDPVDRVISRYRHALRAAGLTPEALPIQEWLDRERSRGSLVPFDHQVRLLGGDGPDALGQAIARLKRDFVAVGFVDTLPRFVRRLSGHLGIDLGRPEVRNATPKRAGDIPESWRTLVADLNRGDIELVRIARTIPVQEPAAPPPPATRASRRPAASPRGHMRNLGSFALHDKPVDGPATVLVLGAARGGTSLVAGVLHHLGLFMGDAACPPVFEDVRLAGAIEKGADASKVIADYDRKHRLWGFKRPDTLARGIGELAPLFRAPRLIVVCKDLAAIAARRKLSSLVVDQLASMRAAWRDYGRILDHLEGSEIPTLVISAEKAIEYRQQSVDAISAFAGLDPTPAQRRSAIQFITPEPKDYLERARVVPVQHPPRKPDFVCIGAQKAGTTWLHDRLGALPGISLPKTKELHFLDLRWNDGFSAYEKALATSGGMTGDITPAYAIVGDDRIAAFAARYPGVRTFMILRDPVSRAWSAMKMHALNQQKEGLLPRQSLSEVPESWYLAQCSRPGMVMRGDYASSIRRWRTHYPQLGIFFYEDLCRDPRAFLQGVLTHIGAPPQAMSALADQDLDTRVFASDPTPMPAAVRAELRRLHIPHIQDLAALLGRDLGDWCRE
ncbi:MAG: hypothetical protein RLZZ127_2100 [Planctomycetota bacterium]|jgi:hypothetical protein